MRLYVESNFVLELAYSQESHSDCSVILQLAKSKRIELALPAFAISEPFDSYVRRATERSTLSNQISVELTQLARNGAYTGAAIELKDKLVPLLAQSIQDQRERLHAVIEEILAVAHSIPTDNSVVQRAVRYQKDNDMAIHDSFVLASVLSDLEQNKSNKNCFITRNREDFNDPTVRTELQQHDCRLIFDFRDGLGYINSEI